MDESTETTTETTTAQTVGNAVVLTFAIIGAVQTTRYAVVKVRSGIRAVKAARAQQSPSES